MVAHLYIIAESFQNNNYTDVEVEEKIERLAEDMVFINQYKDSNKLYANYKDVYPQMFLANFTLFDFICNPGEVKKHVNRNVVNAVQNIFKKALETSIRVKEVREVLLNWNDENNCHGLIAFHKMEGVDETTQLIYGKDSWFHFRQHYLALYPKNAIFFIDECIKYFPNLFFHQRNKETTGEILHNCSKKVVYHLAALNDRFKDCILPGLNRTQVLERFTITAGLDAMASLEGDAARKHDFTFVFINSENKAENICCEPHLKLCYNDNYPGDSSYSNGRRIYFYEGKANIQNGKILIGHIGAHL